MTITAGLDVGGAHLKVALIEGGRTTAVQQILCPLWQGIEKLDAAIAEARPLLTKADQFAITMTGELSDLFPNRKTGVETLVTRLQSEFGNRAHYWMGVRGFGTSTDALAHPDHVGSTNFLATAQFVATHLSDGIVIDFGTTTVDIVPIAGGRPVPEGLTDAERQSNGELVYTGYTRTAVMGVADVLPFRGAWVGLAREYLATMSDIRRVLGVDLDGIDLHETADGKGKTLQESVTRFARMLGRDAEDAPLAAWQCAAEYVRERQLRSIYDGALIVLSRRDFEQSVPIILAGVGTAEVSTVAERLGRKTIEFSDLANATADCRYWATASAPAVAVGHLCAQKR